MNFEIRSVSAVVLAQDHNPSILHPAFLQAQEIVAADWPLAEPPFCTPALSLVKYENGIQFLVESSKLQVQDTSFPQDCEKTQVVQLALKYITTLPHVRYTAVGINFQAIARIDHPERYVLEKCLGSGPWNDGEFKLKGGSVKLVYELEDALMNVSIDALQIVEPGKVNVGLGVNVNFHTPTQQGDLKSIEEALNCYQDRLKSFNRICSKFPD